MCDEEEAFLRAKGSTFFANCHLGSHMFSFKDLISISKLLAQILKYPNMHKVLAYIWSLGLQNIVRTRPKSPILDPRVAERPVGPSIAMNIY